MMIKKYLSLLTTGYIQDSLLFNNPGQAILV